jgi:DNA-binding SARP family transcriptional activator
MLELRLFGTGQARLFDRPLAGFPNQQAYSLLCFLLLNRGRSHHRERLAALFWGDHSQERARSCLNTALWRLRQALEPDAAQRGTYLVTTGAGEVGFNQESDYWLDVATFEESCDQVLAGPVEAMQAADVEVLEKAIGLYSGELLEGLYEDWALRERERLRRLYLNSLARLMQYHKHHQALEAALACGQRILDQAPLREEIHREMMRLYLANGQRARAVRQYQICSEVLDSELGIPPMEETQTLFTQIVGGAESHPAAGAGAPEPVDYKRAVEQLRLATQSFDEARAQLDRAIRLVEQYQVDQTTSGDRGTDGVT